MFKNLFDKFDDFDANKVMEVVNLVWNNRDRIMDLVERLPELLRETGDNIESAGASAVKASAFLVGGGRNKMSAGDLSEMAADALDRCYSELRTVARAMDKIGEEIDDIRIPSFRAKHTKIAGVRVISGFDIGENPMVDNAAGRLKDGSDRIDAIGKDLRTVAKNLRHLGTALTDTGGDLHNVGLKLQNSGKTLRSFADMSGGNADPQQFGGNRFPLDIG